MSARPPSRTRWPGDVTTKESPTCLSRSMPRIQNAVAIRRDRPRSGRERSTGRIHAHVSGIVESVRDLTSAELSRQFTFSF